MGSGPGPPLALPPSRPPSVRRKESPVITQALLAVRALATASPDTLETTCGKDPGIACRVTWDILHDRNAAELVKVYLAGPVSVVLRIIFVLLVAVHRPVPGPPGHQQDHRPGGRGGRQREGRRGARAGG